MPWAAQILPREQIGAGMVQCTFQFRNFVDPNHNNQKRLDILLRRADGVVIAAHPGDTVKSSEKLKVHSCGVRL